MLYNTDIDWVITFTPSPMWGEGWGVGVIYNCAGYYDYL